MLGRAFAETVELARSTDFVVGFEKAVSQSVGRYLDFLTARPGFVRLVVRECLDGGRFLQGLPEHLAALAQGMAPLVMVRNRFEARSINGTSF
jgi:hypothetical protein